MQGKMQKMYNNGLKVAFVEAFEENMFLPGLLDDMEEQNAGKQDIVLQYDIFNCN